MLRFVKKDDVHVEWDRIRIGLLAVQSNSVEDWLPEDVYMMLQGGACSLHIGENEAGEYMGFLILQVLPTFHAKRLHIWAAYSATKQSLMAVFWPQIQEIAKQVDVTKITFMSPREEWASAGKRLGFEPAQTQYQYKI